MSLLCPVPESLQGASGSLMGLLNRGNHDGLAHLDGPGATVYPTGVLDVAKVLRRRQARDPLHIHASKLQASADAS